MRFTDIRDSIVSIMKQNLEVQQSGKATDASILNPFVVGTYGIGKTCCVNDAIKVLGDDWGCFPIDCQTVSQQFYLVAEYQIKREQRLF